MDVLHIEKKRIYRVLLNYLNKGKIKNVVAYIVTIKNCD